MLDKVNKVIQLKKELDRVIGDIEHVERAIESNKVISLKLIFTDITSIQLSGDKDTILKIAQQYIEGLKLKQTKLEKELESLFIPPKK